MPTSITITPPEYYKKFQAQNASWITTTYNKMDSVILPFPQNTDVLILYHGTDDASLRKIAQEGFRLTATPKHKGGTNVGEFCEAISFSPSERVASVFGNRVLKARVTIKNPHIVIPAAWASIMTGIQLVVNSKACECFGGQSFETLSSLKRAGIIPHTLRQIVSDYVHGRQVDGIFCEDSITPENLKLKFKQSQWAIFDPNNIDLVGVIRRPLSHLQFRCHFALNKLETSLAHMR